MKFKGLLFVFVIASQICFVRSIWEAFYALEQAKTSTTQGKKYFVNYLR